MNSDRFQAQASARLWRRILRSVLGTACFGALTAWPAHKAWSDPPVVSGRPVLAPRLDAQPVLSRPPAGGSVPRPSDGARPLPASPVSTSVTRSPGLPAPLPPGQLQAFPAAAPRVYATSPEPESPLQPVGFRRHSAPPQSHPELMTSGVSGPHHYLVLDARPMPKHPLPPLKTGDTRQSVPNRPYAYGWFGARPAQNHWSRHFGATGQQLQWTRK
jgi:hypothetical protein